MQVSTRPALPLILTLAAAALTTSGCDSTQDAVSASPTDRLIDLTLSDPAYYVNLGNEFRTRKKFDEAIVAYQKAIQIDRNNAEAYDGLGRILVEQRRTEEAIAAYRRAVQIDPDSASAYSGLGNALADQSRSEEAIAAYRRAIQAEPDYAGAYAGIGNVLVEQRKVSEAVANYQRALNHSHQQSQENVNSQTIALVGLGRALQAQGKLDAAIAMFRKAAKISPDYVWTYIYLGHALCNQRRFVEASKSYREVLDRPLAKKSKLGSSYALARNGLGVVLQRQGKLKPAIEEFEQAVGLDFGYESAQSNLRQAKQLAAKQPRPSLREG